MSDSSSLVSKSSMVYFICWSAVRLRTVGEDGPCEEPEDRRQRLPSAVVAGDDQVDVIGDVVGVADGDDRDAHLAGFDYRLGVGCGVCHDHELGVDVAGIERVGERAGHEPARDRDGARQLAELLYGYLAIVLAGVDDGVRGAQRRR